MSLVLRPRAVALSLVRTGQALLGTVDGVNQTFTTPDPFVHAVPGASIAVYYNGQRLALVDDYTVSAPTLVGFTQVDLLIAPKPGDRLIADYIVDA